MFNPEFCEFHCPICTRARKGNRIAVFLQRIEMLVTFGGCPWGRARQRKYGVAPSEPLPSRKQQRSRNARELRKQKSR
jgi:ribosome-binding protein aMBF1 (putative translation factor)